MNARYQAPASAVPWPAPLQAWGVVALLMAANFISYVDRSILSLLVSPIKHSLQISDTKVGLLQSAFGIFFTLTTFPAGWIADKGNRMRLIAWGITCWSVMTVLCGMCVNFTQLFAARMGVAVGEAILTPTSASVISDNFPPERRTLPLSFNGMAGALGLGVSLLTGGFVASLVSSNDSVTIPGLGAFAPWQITFFAVGLPGLLVSLMLFFAREPLRRDKGESTGTLQELWEVMKSRRAILVPHFTGVSLYFIHSFAYAAWIPAFLMRVHGWSIAQVGLRYGSMHLVCSLTGGLIGGWIARLIARRGRRDANLLSAALLIGVMVVPAVLGPSASNGFISLFFIGLTSIFSIATVGPNVAAIQEIIPNRLRGRVTAIYFALISLVGATFGPLIIGVLNDYVFNSEHSIGKSLALNSGLTLPLGALLVFIASRQRSKLDWVG